MAEARQAFHAPWLPWQSDERRRVGQLESDARSVGYLQTRTEVRLWDQRVKSELVNCCWRPNDKRNRKLEPVCAPVVASPTIRMFLRLRMRWVMASPPCRVVRLSIAAREPVGVMRHEQRHLHCILLAPSGTGRSRSV